MKYSSRPVISLKEERDHELLGHMHPVTLELEVRVEQLVQTAVVGVRAIFVEVEVEEVGEAPDLLVAGDAPHILQHVGVGHAMGRASTAALEIAMVGSVGAHGEADGPFHRVEHGGVAGELMICEHGHEDAGLGPELAVVLEVVHPDAGSVNADVAVGRLVVEDALHPALNLGLVFLVANEEGGAGDGLFPVTLVFAVPPIVGPPDINDLAGAEAVLADGVADALVAAGDALVRSLLICSLIHPPGRIAPAGRIEKPDE